MASTIDLKAYCIAASPDNFESPALQVEHDKEIQKMGLNVVPCGSNGKLVRGAVGRYVLSNLPEVFEERSVLNDASISAAASISLQSSSVEWVCSVRGEIKKKLGTAGLSKWDSCLMEKMFALVSSAEGSDLQDALAQQMEGVCAKLHATTRGKLCFNDGVYDFAKRAFYAWSSRELQDKPVYSLVKIHRNFPTADSVPQAFKDECTNKIFIASMGEENAKLWMQFLARAVACCIQDKLWAVLMTNRDCSKGVLNDWLMSAFGAYAKQTESENFLVQRDRSGDAAKKNAWLVDFQPVRLMLVQEFPLDMGNKRLKIDSKLIKSINSGGDEIEGRKNYKDAMTFNVQCSSIFMLNDAPPLTTDDVLEKCLQTTSTVQFKSREYIDAELLAADGQAELLEYRKKNYKIADPGLRCAVKSDAYANALVHILIDHYSDTAVQLPKLHVEGEQDQRLDERVLAAFKLTGDVENDFVSAAEMREALTCPVMDKLAQEATPPEK